MSNRVIALLTLIASFNAIASTTNVIDIAALAGCKTGAVNGWTVNNIDSYSDKTSVRVNNNDEFLISPDFHTQIEAIIIEVKSSSQAGRRLAFIPQINGEFSSADAEYCKYSASKNTYEPQILDNLKNCTCFKIAFAGPDDSNTGWGISYLAVITKDIPGFKTPETITIDRIKHSRATVHWINSALAVSNVVTVSSVTRRPASYSEHLAYDFMLCVNTGSSDSQDKSTDLHDKYPALSAEKLYYPANSSGAVRISTKDTNGRLTHDGLDDYTHVALQISAKRYSGDNNCSRIWAYYLDDNNEARSVGSMPISDEFTTGTIDLRDVPAGRDISIGNLDGTKSNRRFIINRIAFLGNYIPETAVTNIVSSITVVGGNTANMLGLDNDTEHLVSVTSFDAAGNHSTPSEPTSFRTSDTKQSMLLRFR